MHQQRGKRILIYFVLLFFVGSINNVNLTEIKLLNIKNVNISGLDETNNIEILAEIKNVNLGNIFFLNTNQIKNIFENNSLVETYEITKLYPATLNVQIEKTKFLARINKNGKIFLIGSNGKLTENQFSNQKLPFIFGNPDINEFLDFMKIITNSKISYKQIKNLYFFQSRRWDLEIENNVLLRLPTDNINNSLDLAFEFLKNNDLQNKKTLDLRIKNQIILND